MGHPGVALRDLEASRDALNPNPQKGGYPAPNRVTFLTGANRDFPNWRRQLEPALRDFYEAPGAPSQIPFGSDSRVQIAD
jgi:hypothetical protein